MKAKPNRDGHNSIRGCFIDGKNDFTERQLADLTAAVIDVFSSKNDKHGIERFFTTRSDGKDLDPVGQLFVRRGLALRRCISKKPRLREQCRKVLKLYMEQVEEVGIEVTWYCKREKDVHQQDPKASVQRYFGAIHRFMQDMQWIRPSEEEQRKN